MMHCIVYTYFVLVILTSVFSFQNIQSTSEKALRSGDGGTIADLVFSHHRSLELMTNLCEELETLGQIMEKNKTNLTGHIHTKLKEVTQLQKKVADSNNQLVILHEHVKLAKKRFEILEQVCSAPDVLGTVLTEVERRRLYNSSLEKVSIYMCVCKWTKTHSTNF